MGDDAGLQLWRPQPVMLSAMLAGGPTAPATIDFAVPIPDSRLRVKVALIYVIVDGFAGIDPSGGTSISIDGAHTLWLCAREQDRSGRRGNLLPVQNLEGTRAAPTVLCPNDGTLLLGYGREFGTAADEIFGRLTTTGQNATPGRWFLQCKYQPEGGAPMDPCEWEKIKGACNPGLQGTPSVTIGGTYS